MTKLELVEILKSGFLIWIQWAAIALGIVSFVFIVVLMVKLAQALLLEE